MRVLLAVAFGECRPDDTFQELLLADVFDFGCLAKEFLLASRHSEVASVNFRFSGVACEKVKYPTVGCAGPPTSLAQGWSVPTA